MSSVKLHLHPHTKKNGANRIEIHIRNGSQRVRISTKYEIQPSYWSETKNTVKDSAPGSKSLKARLQVEVGKIQSIIAEWDEDLHGEFNVKAVKAKYQGNVGMKLLEFTQFIEDRKIAEGRNGTALDYRKLRTWMQNYLDQDVTFKQINTKFLEDLKHEFALRKISGKNYLITLRKTYNQAIKHGHAFRKDYPFGQDGLTIGKHRPRESTITLEDLRRLLSYKAPTPTMQRAIDFFAFMLFSRGMESIDAASLTNDNLTEDEIFYTRTKTGVKIRIARTPQLNEIIKKYKGQSRFLIPILPEKSSTSGVDYYMLRKNTIQKKVNNQLKKATANLGIEASITSKQAKHALGILLNQNGYSVGIIKDFLNHEEITTSQNYMHTQQNDIIDMVNQKITSLLVDPHSQS